MIKKKNDSECIIELTNGSIYQLQGSDDSDRLRGPGAYGYVLDEFATMKLESWQVIEPAAIANNAWVWFVGTPRGKNHLFEFYHRGQGNMKGWKSWILNGEESGVYNAEQLSQLKTSMTQAMYQQEIMCNFLETEGTVFRGVRLAMTAAPQSPKPQHLYVVGVDLAKVSDYTVITVFDRTTNAQVYQDRFNTIEWPFQKARIKAIAKAYNNATCVIDATGLGDPIADDLQREGVAVDPVKISEPIKKELIEKLSIWLEQKRCAILPIEESLQEFENFSYEIGATGKIRYTARTGFHDDIILATALAVYRLNPLYKEEILPETPRIRQEYLRRIEQVSQVPAEEW